MIHDPTTIITEEEILDSIFGKVMKWKGYTVKYCYQCEVFSIKCKDPNCLGSSCNSGRCDKCRKDFDEFNKLKICPFNFLSKEEQETYHKIHLLKQYIETCFEIGVEPIDWQALKDQGFLCDRAYRIFVDETKNLKESANEAFNN